MPKLEQSLKKNIEASYNCLAKASIKDLDTDIEYAVSFLNDKKLWKLEVLGSKDAEVLDEDRDEFFASDLFKKFLKKASTYVENGLKVYEDIVKQHVEDGELLAVDETKLERVIFACKDKLLLKSFKAGKFLK